MSYAEFIAHDHKRFKVEPGDYLENSGVIVDKVIKAFDVENGDPESGVYVVSLPWKSVDINTVTTKVHRLHSLGVFLEDVGTLDKDNKTTKGYSHYRHDQSYRRIRAGDYLEHNWPHGTNYSKVVGTTVHAIIVGKRKYNDVKRNAVIHSFMGHVNRKPAEKTGDRREELKSTR